MQLCRVAAALVRSDEETVRNSLQQAIDNGITASQLREVILTSYLFDGYPTALEGFRLLSEITSPSGVDRADLTYTADNITAWRKRGEPLCRKIYGTQYEPLMARVAWIAPELSDAMIVEGYGKVLSRDGLEPRQRELCVVAILAVKFKPRQLLSHALGALRLGATPEQLLNIIDITAEIANDENSDKARTVIKEAIDKYGLP